MERRCGLEGGTRKELEWYIGSEVHDRLVHLPTTSLWLARAPATAPRPLIGDRYIPFRCITKNPFACLWDIQRIDRVWAKTALMSRSEWPERGVLQSASCTTFTQRANQRYGVAATILCAGQTQELRASPGWDPYNTLIFECLLQLLWESLYQLCGKFSTSHAVATGFQTSGPVRLLATGRWNLIFWPLRGTVPQGLTRSYTPTLCIEVHQCMVIKISTPMNRHHNISRIISGNPCRGRYMSDRSWLDHSATRKSKACYDQQVNEYGKAILTWF